MSDTIAPWGYVEIDGDHLLMDARQSEVAWLTGDDSPDTYEGLGELIANVHNAEVADLEKRIRSLADLIALSCVCCEDTPEPQKVDAPCAWCMAMRLYVPERLRPVFEDEPEAPAPQLGLFDPETPF